RGESFRSPHRFHAKREDFPLLKRSWGDGADRLSVRVVCPKESLSLGSLEHLREAVKERLPACFTVSRDLVRQCEFDRPTCTCLCAKPVQVIQFCLPVGREGPASPLDNGGQRRNQLAQYRRELARRNARKESTDLKVACVEHVRVDVDRCHARVGRWTAGWRK